MDVHELLTRLERATAEYRAAQAAAQADGAALLKAARGRLGMTQRELAEKIGVTHTYVSKVENGHARIGRPTLTAIATLLAQPVEKAEVG